jgi:hypothetical protein
MRKGDAERRGYLCSAGALTGDDGESPRRPATAQLRAHLDSVPCCAFPCPRHVIRHIHNHAVGKRKSINSP